MRLKGAHQVLFTLLLITATAVLASNSFYAQKGVLLYPEERQLSTRSTFLLNPSQVQLQARLPSTREHQTKAHDEHLILTDLVLVASLDGSIRGIDRLKGRVYWTLAGGGSSLVQSSTHFQSREQNEHSAHEDDAFTSIFVDVLADEEADNLEQQSNDVVGTNEHDVYYIVEPQDGGTLYLYGAGRPLEKLPFTIREIVIQSPLRTRNGTTYIGSKTTWMIAIDPRNGKILQKFDLDHGRDAYVMATQSRLPPHTIFLGRHEYKVTVYDPNNEKWWNLTYNEYVPNKLDWDVPESAAATDVYIAPDANKAITAIKVATGELLWSLDLPFPVVSVFDVYRRKDFTIALSKQDPPKSLQKGAVGALLDMVSQKQSIMTAYIGVHEGTLYAMSSGRYPLVRMSRLAPMYTGLSPGDTRPLIEAGSGWNPDDDDDENIYWHPEPDPECCPGCQSFVDCMIGQHPVIVAFPVTDYHQGKRSKTEPKLLPGQQPDPAIPTYADIAKEGGFFTDGPGRFWKSSVLGLLLCCYIYRHQVYRFCSRHFSHHIVILKQKYHKALTKPKPRRRSQPDTRKPQNTPSPRPPPKDDIHSLNITASLKAADVAKPKVTPARVLAPEATAVAFTPPDLNKPLPTSAGLDLQNFEQKNARVLKISDTVLGYGSHGTVVYKGEFDGRAVAVKRLLIDFYDVAFQEVKLLQESDDHPNVVRYFYKEESDRFLYIALELCYGSLHDYMDRSLPVEDMRLFDQMDPGNILRQIMSGIQHLHSLKIVHRDIKPQNILLAPSKHPHGPPLRILLSDFGLCKKLEGEQSSFHYTTISPAGTAGWRAPELLKGALAEASDSNHSNTPTNNNINNRQGEPIKATRAIDIFSAGCVFYYVLSGGDHPFGNRFGRENNILKGDYSLAKLQDMGEDGVEAIDLIERMISYEPRSRPTASVVLAHPFFWTPAKRLAFLQDASDRFEVERRDPPSPLLQRLESNVEKVIGQDWYRRIDRVVANDLGKFRKYDGKRIRDLLRALRNKKHHWQDLPDAVKETFGEPPNQYLYYFTARFPHLFLHTYYVVANDPSLREEGSLRQYF